MAVLRKVLIIPVQTCYGVARHHPFVLVWVFLMLLLHRYFPALFSFLVSSSPVIICTSLLLGMILIYGEPNIPEIDKERKGTPEISSFRAKNARNVVVGTRDDNITGKDHVERDQIADEGEKDDTFADSSSLVKKDKRILDKKKMPNEIELLYQGVIEKRELLRENEYNSGVSTKSRRKKSVGLEVDMDKHDTSSGSESDTVEDSSHSASEDDVLPIIDELHPLLNSERPKHAHKSADNSDAVSSSFEDDESDDVSAEGEILEEEEEDDGGGADEKDDGTEVVLKWTADDQKNLMDLGSSEFERNQRLENLIAKRIAKKRFQNEKNLIDLESNNMDPIMEQLSGLQVQIRPRQNPFDLPYGSEQSIDLPPIPGSAPSILLPRLNPFELPEDTMGESSSVTNDKTFHPGFVSPVPQKEIFLRRHESFSVGPSFTGELKQEMGVSRFRPYFVADKMDSEETSFATLQRRSSGNGDSGASSVAGSDSKSSVVDQDDDKELVEQENHQESDVLSSGNRITELVEVGSQTSEEVDSLDVEQEQNMVDMVDDDNSIVGNISTVAAEAHQDVDEIEEDFDDSSSSSSSKVSNKNLKMSNTGEELAIVEQIQVDSSNASSNLNETVLSDSNLESSTSERVDESQVEDPVYDSSPSTIEKSTSNIASLDGDLFPGDVHIETFEFGSLLRSTQENVSSEDGALSSHHEIATENSMSGDGGGAWVASPSLNFVEQNESISREVSLIPEHVVIGKGFPTVASDLHKPIVPLIPEQIAAQIARRSSLSSVTDSSEDVNVDADADRGS
ncbi:hypothetical protein J5N97_024841 [Dioscorea zingiberensis]|uniref:Uncharacterized protein n=1 Tax=Dioscorea zingiberensis TaxID=325984 RepID=A0A9D5H940_9LILI|nr:hypothetical protein J5N97_024841 [Dioscorea zingiberensis]